MAAPRRSAGLVAQVLTCAVLAAASFAPRDTARAFLCPTPPVSDAEVQPAWNGYMAPAACDSLRNEWVLVLANQPWRLPLGPCGKWEPIPLRTSAPSYPNWAQYDPVHRRILAISSYGTPTTPRGVWELTWDDSASWRLLPTEGRIPVSFSGYCGAVFDPEGQRLIVRSPVDTLWVISVGDTARSSFFIPALRPPPRSPNAMLWDPLRRRVLVQGGIENGLWTVPDTWVLTLDPAPQWQLLATSGPAPWTFGHWGVYDAVRDRAFFQGGDDQTYAAAPRSWSLSLSGTPTWTVTPSRGPHGQTQPSRYAYPVLDRRTGRWLMAAPNSVTTGTKTCGMSITLGDTAVWSAIDAPDAPTWKRLPDDNSSEFEIYDPRRQRLVALRPNFSISTLDLNGGSARQTSSPGGGTGTFNPTMATLDPWTDRLLVRQYPSGEFWALPFAPGQAWRPVPTVGQGPEPFYHPLVTMDGSLRRAFVILASDSVQLFTLTLGDTLAWSAPRTLQALGALQEMAVTLDTRRHRLLCFGGYVPPYTPVRRAWSIDPETAECTLLATVDSTLITPRHSTSITYDPVRDRLIVCGGSDRYQYSEAGVLGILELSGTSRWTRPTTHAADFDVQRMEQGQWPTPRSLAFAFFDPVADRLIVDKGEYQSGDYLEYLYDGWTLDWGHARAPALACPSLPSLTPGELPLSVPVANPMPLPADLVWTLTTSRGWGSASGTASAAPLSGATIDLAFTVPDTAAPGPIDITVVTSLAGAPALADTCVMTASVVVDAPPPARLAFDLRLAGANPAHGALAVELALPARGSVQLDVFDVSGRRVGSEHRSLEAGAHVVHVTPDRALPPGLYAVRARWAGQERVIRAVVLR